MLNDSPDNIVHISHMTYSTFQVRRTFTFCCFVLMWLTEVQRIRCYWTVCFSADDDEVSVLRRDWRTDCVALWSHEGEITHLLPAAVTAVIYLIHSTIRNKLLFSWWISQSKMVHLHRFLSFFFVNLSIVRKHFLLMELSYIIDIFYSDRL